MLRKSLVFHHRTAKKRPFLKMDTELRYMKGTYGNRNLNKVGLWSRYSTNQNRYDQPQYGHKSGVEAWQHAFPLLSHTNFAHNDQVSDTKWIELASYMPKLRRGRPPWMRGANTYSSIYSEQGRYEYHRYLQIQKNPNEYKTLFMKALRQMKSRKSATKLIPLHVIYRMLVDNLNPQHVHYLRAIEMLTGRHLKDAARDVWKIMERQQIWPTDKLIVAYLTLCLAAGEKTWAMECWNRYCSEKEFLRPGEPDPKPVSRVPFAINREELMYLPKWKKYFDHDPNNDVADLNRFNTTREIYQKMCLVMLKTDEHDLFDQLFLKLEDAMMTTPTPVPEPQVQQTNLPAAWDPTADLQHIKPHPWKPDSRSLGPISCRLKEQTPRLQSNMQFYVNTVAAFIDLKPKEAQVFFNRLVEKVGPELASLDTALLFNALLRANNREVHNGDVTLQKMRELYTLKARAQAAKEAGDKTIGTEYSNLTLEQPHPKHYLTVLGSYRREIVKTKGADPKKIMKSVASLVKEMTSIKNFPWSADHHFEIVHIMVSCGTMKANDYFVKNVLQKFEWDQRFLCVLYKEYRRAPTVDQWAELTKRALVWTQRYEVRIGENFRGLVEADYPIIKVQVRKFKDLVIHAFRNTDEKRLARDPASQLPNPVTDYVSHALPFPDRDTGAPDQHGDIGQWRDPASQAKVLKRLSAWKTNRTPWWSPTHQGEEKKGFMSEWREPGSIYQPLKLANPWRERYEKYNKGKHPSYDKVYAGPYPDLLPTNQHEADWYRKPNRWDMVNIHHQSKYVQHGPW